MAGSNLEKKSKIALALELGWHRGGYIGVECWQVSDAVFRTSSKSWEPELCGKSIGDSRYWYLPTYATHKTPMCPWVSTC